jgi:hypothetical protein
MPLPNHPALHFPFSLNYFEPMEVDKRTLFCRIRGVLGENNIKNCISQFENENRERNDHRGPQPIGVVLAELLARYQVRFPEVHIVVETPAVAV